MIRFLKQKQQSVSQDIFSQQCLRMEDPRLNQQTLLASKIMLFLRISRIMIFDTNPERSNSDKLF